MRTSSVLESSFACRDRRCLRLGLHSQIGNGGGFWLERSTPNVCEGVTPGPPPPSGATKGPCDIYAEDGGPCVAAHSTVRALYGGYNGPLYQVKKSDGTTKDIGVLAAGRLRKRG